MQRNWFATTSLTSEIKPPLITSMRRPSPLTVGYRQKLPPYPRYKRKLKRLTGGSPPHKYNSVESCHRHMFYEFLKVMVSVIDKRFDQESLHIPRAIEASLIKACRSAQKGETDDGLLVPSAVEKLYAKDSDLNRRMKMLPDLMRSCPNITTEVTKVRILAIMLETEPLASLAQRGGQTGDDLPHLTCHHSYWTSSFSAFGHIKTYLRSSVTQQRFNNAMFNSVNKPEADTLDLKAIASQFFSRNERRRRGFLYG